MAEAKEHGQSPAVKTCEACGASYPRKPGTSAKQWSASRACSRGCATALGQRNRYWPTMQERFWKKVDKAPGHGPRGDCWVWTGHRLPFGYGSFRCEGLVRKAHRVGYEIQVGPVGEGANVLHRCDNPACVRGDHLFLGDHAANMADMVAKGRGDAPKGRAHHDAKLTEEQVRSIRGDPRSNAVIAAEYGMTKSAIGHIKSRRNWRHI